MCTYYNYIVQIVSGKLQTATSSGRGERQRARVTGKTPLRGWKKSLSCQHSCKAGSLLSCSETVSTCTILFHFLHIEAQWSGIYMYGVCEKAFLSCVAICSTFTRAVYWCYPYMTAGTKLPEKLKLTHWRSIYFLNRTLFQVTQWCSS